MTAVAMEYNFVTFIDISVEAFTNKNYRMLDLVYAPSKKSYNRITNPDIMGRATGVVLPSI